MAFQIAALVLRKKVGGAVPKSLLAVMADFADKSGGNIFPSVATLAHRAEISERSVQQWLAVMLNNGLLKVTGKKICRNGHTKVYQINVQALAALPDAGPAPHQANPPVQPMHPSSRIEKGLPHRTGELAAPQAVQSLRPNLSKETIIESSDYLEADPKSDEAFRSAPRMPEQWCELEARIRGRDPAAWRSYSHGCRASETPEGLLVETETSVASERLAQLINSHASDIGFDVVVRGPR